MEIFKWPSFYFCLLCFQLCNGNPITPNSTEIDSHTKLLTGIISLLLTICGLVFIAACLCCQRRQSFEVQDPQKKFRNSPVIGYSISDIEHGHVNPIANGGEFTIFSPLSPPHFNNNVFHANDETKARTVEDSDESCYDIKSWFSPAEKDFPRNRLKYIKELGSGWFGKVVEGAAQDKDEEQSWTPVVVRILEATSSQTEKILFLQDAAINRCSSHTNILSLVGRSLESVPFLLLQEYCPQGDLKRYLQSNKADAEKLLSTEYPLIWCCQLTSAVKHIHENNIVHHDLASRNCQLASNLTLKLGDYGLGPFRYPADYYQGLPVVPVRWCAPESLVCTQTTIQPKKITPEGNVWSLGVTMWEICECGEQPYKSLNDDEVISQVLVSSSVTLGRPTYSAMYTDYIFRLMKSCWTSVESRPTASQIDLMLTDLLQVHRNTTYNTLEIDEFDKRWESCKPNTIIKMDHITEALLTPERSINKSISPSLTNLHGSLDNLTNEPKNDSLTSQVTSVSDNSDIDTCGAKKRPLAAFTLNSNSLFQRTASSGSETEEENWRNKVERGAYTEKVRQKSRSVADLMVLTHVDYSESESETPLPSLDYRVNYKNVRLAGLEAPGNLENASMTFGSEGNLLSVQDTFQEELRKLQEERRDSLPFVPDTVSQNRFSNNELSSSSKLMQELNSTVDIQPVNQVFNVYNVTIDNFSPIEVQKNALDEIKPEMNQEMRVVDCKTLLNDIEGSENCDNVSFADDVAYNSEIDILRSGDSVRAECEAVNLHVKFGSDSVKNCMPDNEDDKENATDQKLNDEIHQKVLEYDCNEATEFSIALRIATTIVDEILEDAIDKIVSIAKTNDEQIVIENEVSNLDLHNMENFKNRHEEINEENSANKENNTYIKDEEKINVLETSKSKIADVWNKEVKDIKEEDTKTTSNVSEGKQGDTKDIQSVNPNATRIFELETQNMKQVPKLSDIILHSEHLKHLMTKETENLNEESHTNSPVINFDLSLDQEEAKPNSLTHSTMFTSTPFRKREVSLPREDKYSSLNLFSNEDTDLDTDSLSFTPLNYSLETWDNFLGTTLDNHEHPENMFDSFTSEPHSLMYIQDEKSPREDVNNRTQVLNKDDSIRDLNGQLDATYNLNSTYNKPSNGLTLDRTYDIEKKNVASTSTINLKQEVDDGKATCPKEEPVLQASSEDPNVGSFENGGGWFLHPQPTQELCGNIEIQSPITDSYIGFGIDDEIMSAIRNELLTKLPHAQGANADRVREEEEDWDACERNEVFLRYNVYNTPLSPIPEESCLDDGDASLTMSPKPEREPEDADWSGRTDTDTLTHDIESDSAHTLESPLRGQFNRHTPSQDSCCSNDTLFNLEELICVTTDAEAPSSNLVTDIDEFDLESTYIKDNKIECNVKNDTVDRELSNFNTKDIGEFLSNERNHSLGSGSLNFQPNKQIAPLPSPEDNPWKQLPASLLNFKAVTPTTQLSLEETINAKNDDVNIEDSSVKNYDIGVKIIDVKNDESYVKNDESYVKNDESYVKNDESFVKNDDSSVKNDVSPVKSNDSCANNDDSLDKNNDSSDKNNDSPVKNNDSPVKNDDGSVKNYDISVINDDISVKNNDIPVKTINSSVKNDSFVKNDDIPVKTINSSVKNDSFVKNDDSSVKNDNNTAKNDDTFVISDKDIMKPVIEEEYDSDKSEEQNLTFTKDKPDVLRKMSSIGSSLSLEEYEDVPVARESSEKENVEPVYENTESNEHIYENDKNKSNLYENSDVLDKTDVDSYDDYVNIVNMENDKNRLDRDADKDTYIDIYGHDEEAGSEGDNIFGILTDIRFTGPADNQLMSTSFSENNDEQGWESGSDSRSSSSGEFIWKEGEHEESLKALRAAPQDVMETIKPMEGIAEDAYEESDVSSSFTDDEETPEFVPSAWDKFAIPSKSALRSPEKTLNKPPERKSKGVWFKEQKYHCIYEYPKEPESPIMPIQDFWTPQSDLKSFTDWEFDGEVFEQAPDDTTNYTNRTNSILSNQNLYHLTSITDYIPENSTNTNGEFFISSSTQPFHAHSLSSQFFPGSSGNWTFENATPDSGVEDVTPGSVADSNEYAASPTTIPALKHLASEAVAKQKLLKLRSSEVMGGLRHTRNKLKLDLPPSPNAFTAEKLFTIEPIAVEHVIREKPTFTTFGKSRFMVQHVETPTDEDITKNVSFEALPYRPLNPLVQDQVKSFDSIERSLMKDEEDDQCKLKVEVVRGEASLLDSGDEDSGIESASTLERKITNSQV